MPRATRAIHRQRQLRRVESDQYLKYDNPSNDWNGATGDTHLYFTMSSTGCAELTSADFYAKELWNRVYNDSTAQSQCNARGWGYVNACSTGFNRTTNCTGGCHNDWLNYEIILSRTIIYDNDGTQDSRRRLVNHETGHALGLGDPGVCTDNSIMHLRDYCTGNTPYIWPQPADVTSVNQNIFR